MYYRYLVLLYYCLFPLRVPTTQLISLCETEMDQLTFRYTFAHFHFFTLTLLTFSVPFSVLVQFPLHRENIYFPLVSEQRNYNLFICWISHKSQGIPWGEEKSTKQYYICIGLNSPVCFLKTVPPFTCVLS